MPSPKSGDPGSVVPPAPPEETNDAIDAKPGLNAQAAGDGGAPAGADANTAKPYKNAKTNQEKKTKKDWIEVVLLDEEKDPVPGARYQITLPDGQTVAEGTLDEKGSVRLEGIDSGSCQITFPDLDQDAWKPA